MSKHKNSLDNHKIYRQIHSIITTEYSGQSINGQIEKGSMIMEKSSKYNDKGYEIEFIIKSQLSPLKPILMITLDYDDHGQVLIENRYDGFYDDRVKVINTYDKDNNLVESKLLDHFDAIISKTYYEHNGKERSIKETKYDDLDNLKSVTISIYDEDGNKLKIDSYDSDNKLVKRIEYIYCKDFRLQETKTYTSLDESTMIRHIYKYDDFGNEIEEIVYDDLVLIQSRNTSYEYDHKGNWIKCKISERNGEDEADLTFQERLINYNN